MKMVQWFASRGSARFAGLVAMIRSCMFGALAVSAFVTSPMYSAENSPVNLGSAHNTDYNWPAVALVALILCLLAFLFRTLVNWSGKIERTSFLGNLYRESVEETEFQRLAFGPNDKLEKGVYIGEIVTGSWLEKHPAPQIDERIREEINPDPFASLRNAWGENRRRVNLPGLPDYRKTLGGGASEKEEEDRRVLRLKYFQEKEIWDGEVRKEERRMYHADLAAQRSIARQKAESAVDIDLSVLRGRTPAFILEFTAIVIIIFAAMSLGILDILKNEQIGTLLAAIAGYVLGRSASKGSGTGQQERVAEQSKDKNMEQESPRHLAPAS